MAVAVRRKYVVSTLTRDDEFLDLKDSWEALLGQSKANNLFLTWEWLYTWWQVYGGGERLNIVVVRDSDGIKAIAPLFSHSCSGLRCLQFIGSHGVGSDYLDFLLHAGEEEELLDALRGYLDSQRKTWDLLVLSDIPEDSVSVRFMGNQRTYHVMKKPHTTCPYLRLPESWEELVKSFSGGMRYDLSRKQKRFEKERGSRFVVIAEKQELDAAWERFLLLNAERMRGKRIPGPFTDRSFLAFHSRVLPVLFDKGMVRLCALEVGSPIGYIYIVSHNAKYYFYQIGFDAAWSRLSPGTLLFRYSIEHAISEGIKEFDFLQGDEEYKSRWTKVVRHNLRLYILPRSLKGRAILLALGLSLGLREVKRQLSRLAKTASRSLAAARRGRGSETSRAEPRGHRE